MAENQKPSNQRPGKTDFAQEFYWRMREAVTGRLSRDAKRIAEKAAKKNSRPFEPGRDPIKVGAGLDDLLKSFRWESQLAEAELFNNWAHIVGETNAAATQPEALINGTLTIRCKSTAWATQLRLMQTQILDLIRAAHPGVEITSLKLLGPDAPSWKKGPRSVPGRGPRDTYG
jgi:predicted nucleic acid-binding Zn ribbon protein